MSLNPDEIRPGANSSGWLRVWIAFCHPDDIVQHHKSSGWHLALTKSHPDDLLKLRCQCFLTHLTSQWLYSRLVLYCVLLLLGNGWFYPYPSGLLNWRWTIRRLPNSRDANVKNVGKEIMWICRTSESPKSQQSTTKHIVLSTQYKQLESTWITNELLF